MPNGSVSFGGGASGLDPIVPALSKVYTYSTVTTLVRLLAHASGNTTVITDNEILAIVKDLVAQIAKENWKGLYPFYLQNNTFNIQGSSNPYRSDYTTINPYMDKLVGALFVSGVSRTPVRMVDSDAIQRQSKLTTTGATSVIGSQREGDIELFVGSSVSSSPSDAETEMYYLRQAKLNSVATTDYIDLPDNMIADLIDKAVFQLERTKE